MITSDQKARAVQFAAIGSHFIASDTQIIERPGWYQLITPSCSSSSLNEVIFSEIDEKDAESTLQYVLQQYRAHSLPFKWCVGPWTRPADMGSRLERLGFSHWQVRGMACEVDQLEVEIPSDVSVEELSTTNLEDYVSTFADGWGAEFPSERRDALRSGLQGEMRSDSRRRFFLSRVEGRPVGTASYFLNEGSAYLTGGNVLEEYRGRGIYRALIQSRLRVLKSLSIPLAVTHAREKTSASILEKIGFETVFRYQIYEWKPEVRR